MLNSHDIKIIKVFGKVEWLLLGSILISGTSAIALTALIVNGL